MFAPLLSPLAQALVQVRGGPSLVLDFALNHYAVQVLPMAMQTKPFGDIVTFTRSTTAWDYDWQGFYSPVAANVPRIAHDPLTKSTSATPQTLGTGSYTFAVTYQYPVGKAVRVSADAANWMVGRVTASTANSVTIFVSSPPTGAGTYSAWTLIVRRGIRVEEQRTNLLLNSVLAGGTSGVVGGGAVAPTGWSFSGPTPNGEITYAATPFGTLGVRFQATAQRPTFGRSVTALANTLYSYHARITALVGSVEIQNAVWAVGFPVDAVRTFWRNGVTVAGNTIVAAGDHVAVIVTMGATAGTITARLGAGAQTNATCDVTMTMPQVEAGFPSSYIPTEGSQVIRAADVPNVNTLAPWFNPLEGLLVARVIRESISPSQTLVALSGASISTISLESGEGDPAQLRMRVSVDGVQVAIPVAANSSAAYTPIKMAAAYKKDFFSVSANGAPPAEDTSGTVPVVTRLEIGSVNNAARLNGIIESITYHPRVTDTQQASV